MEGNEAGVFLRGGLVANVTLAKLCVYIESLLSLLCRKALILTGVVFFLVSCCGGARSQPAAGAAGCWTVASGE